MRLVQVMFRDEAVPVEIALAKMVLIQKGKGGYKEIGLLEVLWKFCAVVVNCRLKSSVVLHTALHGFITGRGTGKVMLEANLAQNLARIALDHLFQVILDLEKAYNFLDRERLLELLRGYRLGPNLDQLLDNYWWRQRIVPKVGK